MAIRATRSVAICKAKAVYVTSFLSHFKTMNVGTVPGIEPSTSRSAVKLSTDWANPGGGGVLPNITYTGMCRPTGS